MKKFTTFLIIGFFVTTLLTGCGGPSSDLEDRIVSDTSRRVTGLIEPLQLDIYKEGTHQIRLEDGTILSIQSPTINLNNYLNKKVTLKGKVSLSFDGEKEVMTVDSIEFEGIEFTGESKEYSNRTLGISFSYPAIWEIRDQGGSLELVIGEETRIRIESVGSAKVPTGGTPITFAGQKSVRVIAGGLVKLYIDSGKQDQTLIVSYVEPQEDEKEAFNVFLQSFKTLSKIKTGEKCGGEDNLTCPEGYRCELEGAEEKSEGLCVSVDETQISSDCPYVPIPVGCEKYEVRSYNREGCPTSYACLDVSGSAAPLTSETGTSGQTESEKVIANFDEYASSILSPTAVVSQYEISVPEKLIAAVYVDQNEKRKKLFLYTPAGKDYDFEEKAFFVAGEDRDWVLKSGKDLQAKLEKQIVKTGEEKKIIEISSDQRLYENVRYDFSFKYPKNWYYKNFDKAGTSIMTVGFNDASFDRVDESLVTVKIVEGVTPDIVSEKQEARYVIKQPRDKTSHFEIEGPYEFRDILNTLSSSLK